ncbi:hypothetical protein FOZ63_004806 [Perkinsus olseni]|uniref:Uncharacterized protein n=1 Tax=Perkinsus olseni TaxID=32597 RepID=A0A7J6PTC7_PEROL|nr:hypothetical protein FOZ63_004806 [Perkinsus olseni]
MLQSLCRGLRIVLRTSKGYLARPALSVTHKFTFPAFLSHLKLFHLQMRLGIAAIAVFSAVVISPTEGSIFRRRRGTWKDKRSLAGEIATGEVEEKKKDEKSKASYDPAKEQEKRDNQVKLKKFVTDKLTWEATDSD